MERKTQVDKHVSINICACLPVGGKVEKAVCYNPYKELYQDAMFFRATAQESEDIAIARRYYRAALICFCAACEAMINGVISDNLAAKEISAPEKNLKRTSENISMAHQDIPQNMPI